MGRAQYGAPPDGVMKRPCLQDDFQDNQGLDCLELLAKAWVLGLLQNNQRGFTLHTHTHPRQKSLLRSWRYEVLLSETIRNSCASWSIFKELDRRTRFTCQNRGLVSVAGANSMALDVWCFSSLIIQGACYCAHSCGTWDPGIFFKFTLFNLAVGHKPGSPNPAYTMECGSTWSVRFKNSSAPST